MIRSSRNVGIHKLQKTTVGWTCGLVWGDKKYIIVVEKCAWKNKEVVEYFYACSEGFRF